MLTKGIGQPPLRSWHKKRGYLCGRQSDAWTPNSSLMNTLGGEQMAHNVLVSCRGCLPTPRRWDEKNKNKSPVKVTCTWSLGKPLRQKHWPSRWLGLGPQGRRSRGYTMRCINKKLLGPHHMGQNRWKPFTRRSMLLWKSRHGGGGVPPGWKKIYRELPCQVCGPAAIQNSTTRPE